MLEKYIGETAALLTSLCWAFTSIFFTIAVKKIGPVRVNLSRLIVASILLSVFHYLLHGNVLPFDAEWHRWWWLGTSGIIGLVIGDGMLLKAFDVIGTRLAMLIMSLVPIISTILAWIFLNEILTIIELTAIFITVLGIAWVVLERRNGENSMKQRHFAVGVLLAVGGAMGQAIGLLLAKKGLANNYPALSATLIRMVIATLAFWLTTLIQRRTISFTEIWRNTSARWAIIGGSIVGPFLGIWLSLISIKNAHIGIASTLMALAPILLIPLAHWIFRDKVTWRSIGGTFLALVGVAMIFLL
jgi:drug/metabolite transporter (DMT)-like permease